MTATQPSLNLAIHQRTVLVDMATVRAHLGVDADTVAARIESGELRWVFDLALGLKPPGPKGKKRELRFWSRELIAPETCPDNERDALAAILGNHSLGWRGTEIATLLLVSRPTVRKMVAGNFLEGVVVKKTIRSTTEALANFLALRLVGKICEPAQARDNRRLTADTRGKFSPLNCTELPVHNPLTVAAEVTRL